MIKSIFKYVSYFVKNYALVLKSNKDYIFINKNGTEFQVGDIQSADENKICGTNATKIMSGLAS